MRGQHSLIQTNKYFYSLNTFSWKCIVVQWGNWHIHFVSSHSHLILLFSWPAPSHFFHFFFITFAPFSPSFLLPIYHSFVFSWCWSFFVLRADINECERLPQPCAHQCINTPGSFKCTCPPGRHLLGDGKSCAGLERLPSYESYSYGYRSSQLSSERSYQQVYHNLASKSFNSYTANERGRFRSRSRRDTSINSSQQGFLACQQGFESRGGPCFGNYGGQAGLRWGRGWELIEKLSLFASLMLVFYFILFFKWGCMRSVYYLQ